MQEPITTVPWHCGEGDCPVGWHKATYWVDDTASTGYTVDTYTDGDHEETEEADLPSFDREEEAWKEYSRYVLRTSEDPLDEFMVDTVRTVQEKWKFRFKKTPEGLKLVEARGPGVVYKAPRLQQLPARVREYLNLDPKTGVLQDFPPVGSLNPAKYLGRWHTDTIEHKERRPDAVVQEELRAAARRHVGTGRKRSRKDWDPRKS